MGVDLPRSLDGTPTTRPTRRQTRLLYDGADEFSSNSRQRSAGAHETTDLEVASPAVGRPTGVLPARRVADEGPLSLGVGHRRPSLQPLRRWDVPSRRQPPRRLPLSPPKITFKTKVFHPNIDSEGDMSLDILQKDKWNPALKIDKVLLSIVSVLYEPLLDLPINGGIADLYENDIDRYDELATACTWEHSSTPIVSHYPTTEELDDCEVAAAQAAAEKAEAEKLRRREKEAEEKRLAASPDHGSEMALPNESLLSLLWRKVLAFLFRDGPLPCGLPGWQRRKIAQE